MKYCYLLISFIVLWNIKGQAQNFPLNIGEHLTDEAYACTLANDGGLLVLGYTTVAAIGENREMQLVKLNEDGHIEWTKNYGGPQVEYGRSVRVTTDGGLIIVGLSNSFGTGNYDAYVVKTDGFGEVEWVKVLGSELSETAIDVAETPMGGYIILGSRFSEEAEVMLYFIHLDATGTVLWEKEIGIASNHLSGIKMIKTSDENYVITGQRTVDSIGNFPNPNAQKWQTILLKIDIAGNIVWQYHFELAEDESNSTGYDLVETADGGFLITGDLKYDDNTNAVYFMKTDAMGNELWDRKYETDRGLHVRGLAKSVDGGFVATGYGWNDITSAYADVMLLKIDALGELEWMQYYGHEDSDLGNDIATTDLGETWIVGRTKTEETYFDMYILKVDENGDMVEVATGLSEVSPSIAPKIAIYPNPIKDNIFLKIPTSIAETAPNITLTLYDARGKAIFNTLISKSTHEISVQHLPSGLYYYTFYAPENHFFKTGSLSIVNQ